MKRKKKEIIIYKIKMSFKEDLKCSYCPKVLKDPIILPCQDTICKEHLDESNIKSIQCLTCNEEFNLENIEFKIMVNLKSWTRLKMKNLDYSVI